MDTSPPESPPKQQEMCLYCGEDHDINSPPSRFLRVLVQTASMALDHHPTEGGCAGGDYSIDTSYHRHSSSLEDWDAACGLGYRRRWW